MLNNHNDASNLMLIPVWRNHQLNCNNYIQLFFFYIRKSSKKLYFTGILKK